MNAKLKDETGKRFGKLTVASYAGAVKGLAAWNCVCDCGNTHVAIGVYLRAGRHKSCGCLALDRAKAHQELIEERGSRSTPRGRTYFAWANMKARCYNESSKSFHNYGGRGITVCDRWRDSFENFLADMGVQPPGLTLDRVDNSKGYAPGNCQWATRKQQMNNVRYNHLLTHAGKTLTMATWAEICGVAPSTMLWRVRTWGVAKAVSTFNKLKSLEI